MTMDTVNTMNTFISYHIIWTIWSQTPNLCYTLYVCILQLSDEILIYQKTEKVNWHAIFLTVVAVILHEQNYKV